MKKTILILCSVVLFISCSKNDDSNEEEQNQNPVSCNGDNCAPSLGTDEEEATLPSSTAGIYECTYTLADTGSPFTVGTNATFEVKDQTLIVTIDGFDCITLTKPVWRFGVDPSNGNYTFKDNCRDNIAYNLSYNIDGSFNEVNIEVVSGPGFFGQFTLL